MLETDDIHRHTNRPIQLILGQYDSSWNQKLLAKTQGYNKNYFKSIDHACILRWKSTSEHALFSKARSIIKRLAEDDTQFPNGHLGAVHFGIESGESDDIEKTRYKKIKKRMETFIPRVGNIALIQCHIFKWVVPTDRPWVFDETVYNFSVAPEARFLDGLLIDADENIGMWEGFRWDGPIV